VRGKVSRRPSGALIDYSCNMCLAVPGRVLSIRGDDPLIRCARVDFGGVVKDINLAYAPDAAIGDYVLVHVGFAMTVIDEAEAQRIYADLLTVAGLQPGSAGAAVPAAEEAPA